MLFYQKVAPINKERHAKWGIAVTERFDFAREINSVPLTALEFPSASKEFAIVFARNDDGVMPIVVLGLRNNENLFVDAEGQWLSHYIPAFVRRYPFIFYTADEGKNLTLCLDEDYAGCSENGEGQRLFTDDGENTPYLNGVVDFLRDYQNHFRRTQAFGKKLDQLELFEPMGAQFTTPSGEKGSLSGFLVVNREKLKALPGETLAELAKTDELEMVYLHMNSLTNLRDTIKRLGPVPEADGATV